MGVIFSITCFMTFLTSIAFGFLIYSTETKSVLNRKWIIFSSTIGLWSLGLAGVTYSTSYENAVLWQYMLDIAAILIPATYYSFTSELGKFKNAHLYSTFIYSIASVLILFSLTPYFKLGVENVSLGVYWIVPGSLYLLFPAFFLTVGGIANTLLFLSYKREEDAKVKKQLLITLIATSMSTLGGATNFFPQMFGAYPFGNYFVMFYIFFMSYGVLRHGLMSAKVVAAQLFAGASVLLYTFSLLNTVTEVGLYASRSLIAFITLIFSIGFSYLLVRSVQNEINERARVQHLAEQLEVANESLEKLSQQKSEFLSIATHQLRTPLTAVNGYSSLLLGGSYGEINDRMKEILGRIVHSGVLMSQTIEDFLSVSRIEQGRMVYDFSDFDVRTLITEVTTELAQQSKYRKLDLTGVPGDVPLMVNCDYGKIKHVISNLTDNAIKYTEAGSVTVTGMMVGSTVRIVVSDTGIGIPEEEIGKLFDKFVRARGASRVNISGTGLGLYVAKQMIEAHKGRVWAESDGAGKGSRFIIELPTTAMPKSE